MVGVIASEVCSSISSEVTYSRDASSSFGSSSSQSMYNNLFSPRLCPLLYFLSQLKHNPFSLRSSSCWGVNLYGGLGEGTLFCLYVLEKAFLVVIVIFLLSTFLAIMKSFSSDDGSKRRTSCWMLSFKAPIKRSNKLSSEIFFTLRLSCWNCLMSSISGPFCLIFTNWTKKVFLLISP